MFLSYGLFHKKGIIFYTHSWVSSRYRTVFYPADILIGFKSWMERNRRIVYTKVIILRPSIRKVRNTIIKLFGGSTMRLIFFLSTICISSYHSYMCYVQSEAFLLRLSASQFVKKIFSHSIRN